MRFNSPQKSLVSTLACAVLLGLSACGGGTTDENVIASSNDADTPGIESAVQAKARTAPPPINPNPVVVPVDSTLALATSNAAGQSIEADGLTQICGISADGSQVALTSSSSKFVAGVDPFNIKGNVFLKNLRTGAVTRINTASTGGLLSEASCVGMTPDASAVVFATPQVLLINPYEPAVVVEAAIYVKNLRTGTVTNVAPPLNTFANIAGYRFQSISDDGNRVALIAEPARQYLGAYQFVALGPAIALVGDIASGALINLSQTISIDLSGDAQVDSKTLLSPDGTKIAFNSRANYPALGDTNGGTDAFLVDIASRSVRLVSPAGASGFKVLSFLAGGNKLALQNDAGVYIKDLGTNASKLVFAATFGIEQPAPSSFSGDGSSFTYTRPYYSTASGRSEAVVRNTASGQEQLVSITGTGAAGNGESRFPLISRDGSRVVFESNATNLVRPALLPTYRTYVKTLSTPAAIPG